MCYSDAFLCIVGSNLLTSCCRFHVASLSGLGVRVMQSTQNDSGHYSLCLLALLSFPSIRQEKWYTLELLRGWHGLRALSKALANEEFTPVT